MVFDLLEIFSIKDDMEIVVEDHGSLSLFTTYFIKDKQV